MDIHHIRLVNLQQAIKKAGSQARLADMVGIKSAYISQIKNTKHPTNMGNDVARRIEAALGLPHGWMDVLHDNEAMRVINGDPMLPPPNLVQMPARCKAPVISYVQAGNWGGLVDPYPVGIGGEEIEIDAKWSANTFVLKVRGDSMAPTLMEGAYIVVDPNVEWMHNRIVVVRQNGDTEVTVKRLVKDGDTYYLKPDNANYRPMEMGKDAHICGVVVELVMKFV